jgi:hypothetical protein
VSDVHVLVQCGPLVGESKQSPVSHMTFVVHADMNGRSPPSAPPDELDAALLLALTEVLVLPVALLDAGAPPEPAPVVDPPVPEGPHAHAPSCPSAAHVRNPCAPAAHGQLT